MTGLAASKGELNSNLCCKSNKGKCELLKLMSIMKAGDYRYIQIAMLVHGSDTEQETVPKKRWSGILLKIGDSQH